MAASFTDLEQYKLTKVKFTDHELGRGSYATVIELNHNGKKCAGKKIHDILLMEGSEAYTICRFEEECRLMSQVCHPNIVEFFGVYFPKGSHIPILVMEFLPINLTYCIEKEDSLPMEMKYSILNDVAQGFFFLHSQTPPIVHRDLSTNNVLLTTNMKAKISDLGVARILNMTPLQVSRMTQAPGTPAYMPPEVMVEKPVYDTSIDKFSYGILMIHVFSGKWPIPQIGQIRTEGEKLIPVTEAERRETFLKAIGDDHPLMDLILRCINNNPEMRPLTSEIVEVLATIVQQFPIKQQAMLIPVQPTTEKTKKKGRKKHIDDYAYVEVEVRNTSNEESCNQPRLVPIDNESKDASIILSWLQKQLMKIRAFFTPNQQDQSEQGTRTKTIDEHLSFENSEQGTQNPEITYPVHAAIHDYESTADEHLSFEKGNLLCIVNTEDKDWWFARSIDEKQGYVPSSHLTPFAIDPNTTLYVHKWFFGDIGCSEATRILLSSPNQDGSYLVRNSQTHTGSYALSLRAKNRVYHYRIERQANGQVLLLLCNGATFQSVEDFVAQHQKNHRGLYGKLLYPCILSQIADLLKHTSNELEIDRKQLKFVSKIGSGQFGEVWKGLWNKSTLIAIKTLQPGAMNPSEFLREATIMRKLHHKNILQICAVCTKEEPMYIVSEFMKHGSLLEYLHHEDMPRDCRCLTMIAMQIVDGMAYLEANSYVHRDLAARNVLVGDNLVCKVADFGLARLVEVDFYEVHSKVKLAIKWTAPEALLYNRFTNKSDVWSFGITLYEIFTHGRSPYPGMTNLKVLEKVAKGYRMSRPDNCPHMIYKIMLKCWREDPENRIRFEALQWEFEDILLHTIVT